MIQIAKKYDWDSANKMARRKAGEYDDPDLSKVLEEREKKEEKAKKEKAKLATTLKAKRGGRFYGGSPATSFRRFPGYGLAPVALAPQFPSELGAMSRGFYRGPGAGPGPSFGRRPPQEDQKCHTCNQSGHFWKYCPNKK